jgi:HTH-type transcriptional regulator / antitoxin HigA
VAAVPDLLNYSMDQHGLSRSDLVPMLGTASRVSEVMNGKRELSMNGSKAPREIQYFGRLANRAGLRS